jgi:DNA-binding response OmpR family regulator
MAHIVIIEDDTVLNQAYKLILEKAGHQVRTAHNGAEGLDIVDKSEPDIILLDLLMPTMGGLEFLKEYDLKQKHPKVKVIILSNIGDESEAEKGIQLGAYKYIVKAHASPNDLSVLVNHVINKNLV